MNIRKFLHTEGMSDAEIKRNEFWIQANRAVRETNKPNYQEAKITVDNKWNIEFLHRNLKGFQDMEVLQYLKYGWPLNARNTERQSKIPKNQTGARAQSEFLNDYINKQRRAGTIIGPFHRNPFGRFARISPIDTREKKDSPDLRVIQNLSYPPEGGSVNDSIDKQEFQGRAVELKYPTIDDLAKIVRRKGRGCKIFKRDLAKAYKQFFYCPGDIHLLGFIIDDKLYFDVTLCMGAASSALFCQKSTNMVTHIFQRWSFDNVNYLDDLGGADTPRWAEHAFMVLEHVLQEIGFTESPEKAVAPVEVVTFLGIQFNTRDMTLTLTKDRLHELMKLLDEWITKKRASLRDLQSLLGKLSFAANTVRAGRIFVLRLIKAISSYPKNKNRADIPPFVLGDIKWWKYYMARFDGVSLIPDYAWKSPKSTFATDACLTGCGGYSGTCCFRTEFPEFIKDDVNTYINELETLTIILAVKLWREDIRNHNVLIYCDNQVSVDIINTGKAKNSFAQECLRELCYVTATENAVVKVVFREGVRNEKADKLSRSHTSVSARKRADELIKEQGWQETIVDPDVWEFQNEW